MKRFNITKYGYKFDKVIFWSVMFILISIFGVVLYNNDFEIDKNYISYECLDQEFCTNPLSLLRCSNEMVWGKDCSIKCKGAWCSMEFLPPGKYGEEEPRIVEMFPFISIVLLIISFLLNHQLHNKGKDFDLEIVLTKKIRFNLSDMARIYNKELGKDNDN